MSRLRLVLGNLLVLILMYVAAEVSYSTYRYVTHHLPPSYWLYEHIGETLQFDPSRGVLLTRVPSRFTRISYGQIEYVGTYRGNNQGFPDRNDFTPERSGAKQRRFAVFGDSFTAAQYIALNWPNRVEEIYAKRNSDLQLLNFSLDGVGLANWDSILRNVVAKDHYELDGLILAVWMDNLDRPFRFTLPFNERTLGSGHVPRWDAGGQPRTLAEARKILKPLQDGHVVSSAEFDAALAGNWSPPRMWLFKGYEHVSLVMRAASKLFGTASQDPILSTSFEPGQLALAADIKEFARQRSLPILVVYIPDREELLQPQQHSGVERVKRFSQILGATFLDGRAAFTGLNNEQIKADWLPYDGHWNQAGSDRFSDFMARSLQAWPPSSGAVVRDLARRGPWKGDAR